jgi:hypothetical protein
MNRVAGDQQKYPERYPPIRKITADTGKIITLSHIIKDG